MARRRDPWYRARLAMGTTVRTARMRRAPGAGKPLAAVAQIGSADAPARDAARLTWLGDAREVAIGRGDAPGVRGAGAILEIRAADGRMSSRHARLVRDGDGFTLLDDGSTNGTFVAGLAIDRHALRPGEVFETGRTFWRFVTFAPRDASIALGETRAAIGPTRTIAPALVEQIALTERVARGRLPLLILGETGAGKEVLARDVHARSGRRGELRAVNCAAIPAPLLEGELFGHRRGAYTGAAEDRAGLIEGADGGTLLLDEAGDLPPEAQAKLLRVLQDGEIVRLGESRPRRVDVRVLSATHRDLPALVRAGRFREDLYGRLAGFIVRLPPLRERLEDLGILIAHLVRRYAGPDADAVRFEVEAMRVLLGHRWPFNVRELERMIEAVLLLARGAPVGEAHVRLAMEEVSGAVPAPAAAGPAPTSRSGPAADDALRARIERLLDEHRYNVSAVARALGKSRTQVHRWMRRFGLTGRLGGARE